MGSAGCHMTLLTSRLSRHLLDHLNHGVRRLFPLLVTQLDQNQLKSHSLLLQARLKVINLNTEGYFSRYLWVQKRADIQFLLLCPPCHNSLERSWSCILPSLWPTYHCPPSDAFPAKSQPDVCHFLESWRIHISSIGISSCYLKGFPSLICSWHSLFHEGQSPEIWNIHILNDVMNWWLIPV